MAPEANDLFHGGKCCNAAWTVYQLLETKQTAPAECPGGEQICGALNAALSLVTDSARAEMLRHEFIKLTGAAECASLKGKRCAYYTELAAELVRKFQDKTSAANKKRALLLGDSIRGNYENVVREELRDVCDVIAPEENCRFAKFALNELERWFDAYGEPDVIHWNIGLWDSAVVCREDGIFTKPEEYLFYMSRILRELRKHTPRIIFATTTPVLDGSLNQHLEYIDQLNAAIVPYMRSQGVPINDLYALVKPRMAELLRSDCIHLSPKGAEVCGHAVADAIRQALSVDA